MGLDMYLQARKYVSGYDFNPKEEIEQYKRLVEECGLSLDICPHTPSLTVAVTVAYWRKANAIHQWFVDTCQEGNDDCRESYVEREQLIKLRDLCKRVLDSAPEKFNALAEKLLPPQKGCFFGSAEIDEWYKKDLEETVEQLNKILDDKRLEKEFSFYYHSSW